MADFKVYDDFSVGMSNIDFGELLSGDPMKFKKNLFALNFGDGDMIVFGGADFKYNKKHVPIDGEVRSVTAYSDGDRAFSFSGFELSVKDLQKAAGSASDDDDLAQLLKALSKSDDISGNALADLLIGGGGKDTIYGGGGADKLSGGADGDIFVFRSIVDSTLASMDKIKDFNQAQHDKIDLSALGDLDFVGAVGFSATGNAEVGYEKQGKHTIVSVDTDGDGNADFSIQLADKFELTAADFIL